MERAALEFTMQDDLSELERVPVQALLSRAGASRHALLTVGVTLEEILSNILKYGRRGGAPAQVRVELSIREGEVLLLFEDDGDPFDPTRYAGPRPPASLREARAGGVGLRLVRAMASSLNYRRVGGTNRLEVRVPLHQPLGLPSPSLGPRQPTA